LFCFFFFFSEQRTRRREEDEQPIEGHPVSAEGNVNVGINVVLETKPPGHDNVGTNDVPETEPLGHDNVDEVVKQLLSEFEFTDGEDKDLFYDFDEVRKEREETSH
jgi:hypothetical protein